MPEIEKIHRYIDEHFDGHIERIQEYLRQPSISQTGEGMRETAEMTRDYLKEMLGAESTIDSTSGYPVVFGKLKSKTSNRWMFIYGMYDTQPVEPLNEWTSPPFEARIVDNRIIARGAINSKGPLMATLNALQSILEVAGDLPFNLIFGVEGEEEQASIHLPEWAKKRESELKKCEAMGMWIPSQAIPGAPPALLLGLKGIVYMELECRTNPLDVHSSQANILPNPVWRLVWALNSMRGQDEVLIEGFYDNVEPPPPEDLELVDKYSELLVKAMTASYQVENYRGENPKAMARNLIFKPSPINIDGIISGWTGPGTKTITPAKATVKIDIRLVPNMTTSEVIDRVKNHLKKRGFEDIEVRVLGAYEWVKVSVKDKISQAAIKTFKELNYEPVVMPMLPGSAPFYLFTKPPFNMKFIMSGPGHGGRAHAPNEYLMVDGIKDFEKYIASFLYNYAET
ncbi:MAG: M20/M25/M40 family metallo-hydrolase [Candidatus Freyarchaeota archaeon]